MRFVEVVKNTEWFLKGAGGSKCQKGQMTCVKVLDDLRKHMEAILDAAVADSDTPDAAVADSDTVADEVDPMNALDDVLETPCKKTQTAGQT